jgi:hypothetical protein
MVTVLYSFLILLASIASISTVSIPASAQQGSALSKAMGQKWGDKCIMTAGGATTCCFRERTAEAACKDIDKERIGSSVRSNCESGEKICQTMVRCDDTLNACKKAIMTTDKTCSTAACAKCTSDYKTCHDNALK